MLRYAIAGLLLLTLVGCDEEDSGSTIDPANIDRAEAQCLDDGGQWLQRGSGRFCLRLTPDGGQSCSTRSDCSTQCLARSRTCAPADPMFGCNEVIGSNGLVTTLCVE
ncbi:MAG: hypothetical protein AAGA87_08770 [Pseudomonadota bacterium]